MQNSPFKQIRHEAEEVVEKIEDIMDDVKKKIKKPWYKKIHLWIFLLFLAVIIFMAFAYFTYWIPIKNSVVLAQQTQTSFEKVQAHLLNADFVSAKDEIKNAQQLLVKLEKNIAKLDSPLMVSYLQTQYSGVQNIVIAVQEFSDGLYLLTNMAQDTLSNIKQDPQNKNLILTPVERKEILEKFAKKRPELNGAKAQIDLALIALNSTPTNKLNPQLAKYIIELRVKMVLLRDFLNKAVGLSENLPELLGLNSTKTYLFLLQNNNELRPTGGFIGTVGIMKIKNGEIIDFETDNVYDYDKFAIDKLKIQPPAAINKYTGVKYWYLRDSNWLPDFIESSKKIEEFYHQEANLSSGQLANNNIDGIIAITPKIIEEFLAIVGAVDIDSFVFNKDNFVERLQYLVEVGYEEQNVDYSQRKNIIGRLGQKLIARAENINLNGWVELSKSLFNNLNQKHILINIKNPIVQNNLISQNWTGHIDQTREDYLFVVDANLAALKSNSCVTRQINYSFVPDIETKKIKARSDITYKNNCNFTWKSTRYRTYTRIYVPLGSEWIKTIGSMDNDRSSVAGKTDISEESNKTVFGAFIAIEPDKSGTLSFEYYLPDYLSEKISNGQEYNLSIQKQAGTFADKLNINLTFPYEITFAAPGEAQDKWKDKKYQLSSDLLIDRNVRIGF
ncbi:DUF4012 domain-containing protein [Patescibacteria group bacterium]|nr:DUF4012 domain-containing protein [Patescibacteria group bacterium]MBU4482109.1 DUF4012 domain-containing protein [Patescibacteria group bacterium]